MKSKSAIFAVVTLTVVAATDNFGFKMAYAGYEWKGDPQNLITTVLKSAELTMGKFAKAGGLIINWCQGPTHYDPKIGGICFDKNLIYYLAKNVGDGAVAYVAAHEYAHHIQHSVPFLLQTNRNVLQIELQADCLAGVILATIPGVSFDETDEREMLYAARILGDNEYDESDHHGSGEERALALRAGIRFGSTKQKDNYYPVFCNQK
jgi:hypothetical protein